MSGISRLPVLGNNAGWQQKSLCLHCCVCPCDGLLAGEKILLAASKMFYFHHLIIDWIARNRPDLNFPYYRF